MLMIPVAEKIILLVEDNEDDELLTLHAFKENNILNQVVVARDGAEALDYLFATGKHAGRDLKIMPVLTLLDLNLPKIHGIEVLRRLRQDARTKTIPVVVLTSSAEERDVVASYNFGCNSYIRKPVDMTQFVEAIRQLGLYWLVMNVPPPGQGA